MLIPSIDLMGGRIVQLVQGEKLGVDQDQSIRRIIAGDRRVLHAHRWLGGAQHVRREVGARVLPQDQHINLRSGFRHTNKKKIGC